MKIKLIIEINKKNNLKIIEKMKLMKLIFNKILNQMKINKKDLIINYINLKELKYYK